MFRQAHLEKKIEKGNGSRGQDLFNTLKTVIFGGFRINVSFHIKVKALIFGMFTSGTWF